DPPPRVARAGALPAVRTTGVLATEASGNYSTAVGGGAWSGGINSTALGNAAESRAANSVALGAGSVASVGAQSGYTGAYGQTGAS
ncbi:hypothetical protein J8J17_24090, partial [Mycobacterium tuberculosis]|nr:hypothetical protein [Mycobacterium tuberculosis]